MEYLAAAASVHGIHIGAMTAFLLGIVAFAIFLHRKG